MFKLSRYYLCYSLEKETSLLKFKYVVYLLQNPAIADVYTEHAHPVNVAKYSPSGFYIASGGKQLKPLNILISGLL